MERKEIVLITVVTFIVIVLWVASSIIGTDPSVPENPKLKKLLEPIDTSFDQSVIEKVSQINPIPKNSKTPLQKPSSPSTFLQPEATTSAQEATSSGGLE